MRSVYQPKGILGKVGDYLKGIGICGLAGLTGCLPSSNQQYLISGSANEHGNSGLISRRTDDEGIGELNTLETSVYGNDDTLSLDVDFKEKLIIIVKVDKRPRVY